MRIKSKVISYFFRMNNGELELLVFDHRDFPNAGTQVIGGTLEVGESMKSSMIREIHEESGILLKEEDIHLVGNTTYHRKEIEEINERTYFVVYNKKLSLSDYFEHVVRSTGEDDGMVFNFYWIKAADAKERLTGKFYELVSEASALYEKIHKARSG